MKRGLIFVAMLPLAMVLALPASPVRAATYNFQVDPPNTAEDHATGDVIQISGAGQFSDGSDTVRGNGHFTHFSSTGEVLGSGTWRATDFVGFTSFGGPNPGFQGGVLDIIVTFFPVGGAPVTGVQMRIVCEVNAPPGHPEEGTTVVIPGVASFTEPTGGLTLFSLQVGR